MGDMEVRRWRRFGHDRLYVTLAGERIGHRDLATGEDHPADPDHAARLAEACDAWSAASAPGDRDEGGQATEAREEPPQAGRVTESRDESPQAGRVAEARDEPRQAGLVVEARDEPRQAGLVVEARDEPRRIETSEPGEPTWTDLSLNAPGQGVREEAIAEWAKRKQEKPIRAVIGRVLDVHTDERAWRMGAIGEETVGRRLEKYAEKEPRWHFLHSVPVGSKGSDIDHVAVGPGGVFTINSKHHDGAKVWIAGRTLMVNGHRQPYLRNSHHESTRAAKLLEQHLGWQPPVAAVLALVGIRDLTVKSDPEGVYVVTSRRLARWLKRRPEVLTESQVAEVYDVARRSTTWT